jgi:hypothetical protein
MGQSIQLSTFWLFRLYNGFIKPKKEVVFFLMILPSSEGELLPAPIPPVTLPTLRRLTFRGVDVYLDNFVAQINTPLLERLSLALFFDLAFTLVNLTEFIHRTEGFVYVAARVIFHFGGSASIDAGHHGQRGIGKLRISVNCKPLDWQISSAKEVCSALGKVLSTVEELTLYLKPLSDSSWENTLDDVLWHELLLPFIGVKKLHIGSSLTVELSRALKSVPRWLVQELLPELQELKVPDNAKSAYSAFVKTRNSLGRRVRVATQRYTWLNRRGYVFSHLFRYLPSHGQDC